MLRGRGQLTERSDLLLRGGRGLLGAERRRFGDPGHLFHPPHDLADAPRLALGLARECAGETHGGVQVAEDGVQRLADGGRDDPYAFRGPPALPHGRDQLGDLVLRLANASAHLVGRARALLRQLSDLIGNHAEPEAVLPRARRLDRGVQGEEIRLAGDPGDRVHELPDLARALLQPAGSPGYLVQVLDERHEQLAGAGDLHTVALGLLRDT